MNTTLEKFGFPQTLIKSYSHWSILLRPQQITLGSLILGAHSQAHALSELPEPAMSEFGQIIRHIELSLNLCFKYDKINYLMLMMVDPHVHFHVIPRYRNEREFNAISVPDTAWPGPPNLTQETEIPPDTKTELLKFIQHQWRNQ